MDFKKAYDSVWLDGLWWKLARLGIGKRTYRLISNAYAEQRNHVRFADDLSPEFKIDTGVRQGCVLSPLLFSIYINDILDHTSWQGVITPMGKPLRGLLYTDNLIILADSLAELRKAFSHLSR